ncbi:MAG: hypothetical protein WBM07_01990 [Chitinivibrionales bacterium]
MRNKYLRILSFCSAMSVVFFAAFSIMAQGDCSPLDSTGYVLLHPYFEGKNWETSVVNTIDIILPDTLCSQQLRPARFDVGKVMDSTIAAFSTANGDLFIMKSQYFHSSLACRDELDFLAPQKVPLTGIAFTGSTSWYLVKDTAFNLDTVKIVAGVSAQFCLVATINTSSNSPVKIDTLHMQNAGTILAIHGGYNNVLMRDTCIWVTGTNGMIRKFSYKSNGWGTEVRQDVAATETVLCASAAYAGTNSGRIYKLNTSQVYALDYSASNRPINTLYPQGAIGGNGALIENINGAWRNDTLGNGDYQYANFIETPGGFGVELLDNQWRYSTFTYRDTASKILLTNPVDIMVNNVDKTTPYIYNSAKIASPKDTTIYIYISDPDSNYSDVSVTLNGLSMENNGTHAIGPLPDTVFCQIGALRLTDGVLKLTLKNDSVVLSTQTELGVWNVGCLLCNWKSYNFTYSRHWFVNSALFITAGKDRLIIENQGMAVTTIEGNNGRNCAIKNSARIVGNTLVFKLAKSDLGKMESVTLYDFAGRNLVTFRNMRQTSFEIPRSLTSGIACLAVKYHDGSMDRVMIPLLR